MDSIRTTSILLAYFFYIKVEAVVWCINQIYQPFLEQIILEMSIVSQLLVDMASTSKCSSKTNTESILNICCFFFSEYSNFDFDDKKIAELLLVLQSVLFYVSNLNPAPV
jgi:hypothetical protein